jgi:hypothetical protein
MCSFYGILARFDQKGLSAAKAGIEASNLTSSDTTFGPVGLSRRAMPLRSSLLIGGAPGSPSRSITGMKESKNGFPRFDRRSQ